MMNTVFRNRDSSHLTFMITITKNINSEEK